LAVHSVKSKTSDQALFALFDRPAHRHSDLNLFVPEGHPSERWIVLLIFCFSFSYLFLFRHYTTMEPDEGIVLQGAQRIVHGQTLYRDFFTFYTPGSYYLLAFLFRIAGSSMAVARTALAVSESIASLLTYLLARRVCSRAIAVITAALVTLVALPFRFLVLHNWDSTLWACLALYCAVRLLESPRWPWAFGTGTFASFTFLFEQSKGVGLILGIAAGLSAIFLIGRRGADDKQFSWTGLAAGLTGLAWPVVMVLTYFGMQHALSPMLTDWVWPLDHYSTANRVTYGFQNWSDETRELLFGTGSLIKRSLALFVISPCFLIPMLPLASIGLLIHWLNRMGKERHAGAPAAQAKSAYYILVNAALAGLLLSVVMTRADIIHFMYLAPLFFLVIAWVMDGRDIPGRIFSAMRPWVNFYVLLAFLALSIPLLLRAARAPVMLATRAGVVTMPGTDTVVGYVQAHLPAGEPIFVYPYLPLYYYLTGTTNPTRYDYFQPGMHTREQSVEMISELESHPVRAILLEASFAGKIPNAWPGTPLAAIANDPAGDYILQHYRTCTILRSPAGWRFLFMVRNKLACP
jgi:hypothetical protein